MSNNCPKCGSDDVAVGTSSYSVLAVIGIISMIARAISVESHLSKPGDVPPLAIFMPVKSEFVKDWK